MPDDKFLDYFIELSEVIAPEKSIYWVQAQSSHLKLVKSSLAVPFSSSEQEDVDVISESINKCGIVYFHSFDRLHERLLNRISLSVQVNWIFWGAEGYQLYALKKTIYLKETRKCLTKLMNREKGISGRILSKFKNELGILRRSQMAKRVIKRADFCCTWINGDYKLMKKVNANLQHKFFCYYSIEQLGLDQLPTETGDKNVIWLGNSADPSNNHLDALLNLQDKNWSGEVIVPLSYNGSKNYISYVTSVGRDLFGDRFRPILDFISKEEYHALMNRCGIIWMNHIRQQAAGNCFAALWLGKKLVLRPESTLANELKSWNLDLSFSINNLKNPDVIKNREILRSQIGIDKIREKLERYYRSDLEHF